MAALIEVIGVVSGVLGIVSFIQDNVPEETGDGTSIRIAVGLDSSATDGLASGGGDAPDVRLFNEVGDFLGITVDAGKIDSGSYMDITVDTDDVAQQSPYILLSGNDDAVCIAYVSMTWPDGNQYGWVGDWGSACGATWYYSNVYVNGGSYKPQCTWVDANGDQPQTGLSMHIPSFVVEDATIPPDTTQDGICGDATTFQIHTEPDPNTIQYKVVKRGLSRTGASLERRSAAVSAAPKLGKNRKPAGYRTSHDNKIVISNDATHHSTERLCTSGSAVGPDFANLAEGLFCRMNDRTLWTICDDTVQDNCFNADSKQLIIGGVSTRSEPYAKVHDWTS